MRRLPAVSCVPAMSDVPVMNIFSAMNTSNRTGRRMPSPISKAIIKITGLVILVGWGASVAKGQTQQGIGDWDKPPTGTLRHPEGLESILKRADLKELARDIERRGDPKRGALLFHRSAAGCRNCHGEGGNATPLGPDLTRGGETQTPEYLVESILFPSRVIRKGYETLTVVKDDGQAISGMVVKQDDREVVLRDAADLEKEIRISRDEIEAIRPLATSLMPEGLIGAIGGQKPFYDLASYVIAVSRGGEAAAAKWRPSETELAGLDDITNLDHAGIIRSLSKRDFTAGETIYTGYCENCHGADGNRTFQANARAFATQKLKYGEDPFRIFMTLSRGNGAMGPMLQLTPRERYQVAHYLRERFIKPAKLDEVQVDDAYLAALPKGTDSGERVFDVERDFGPALASQLGRGVQSALTVKAGEFTVSYDLHSLDLAGVWTGGFLNLQQTQHVRGRGEGTADPASPPIGPLSAWRWGHAGTLDYPTEGIAPRGPMPESWMDYHGHYLHGDRVVLSYAIDRREILETPLSMTPVAGMPAVVQILRVGAGQRVVLQVAKLEGSDLEGGKSLPIDRAVIAKKGAKEALIAGVIGDREGLAWEADATGRLALVIPAEDRERLIGVARSVTSGLTAETSRGWEDWLVKEDGKLVDPKEMVAGGESQWGEEFETTGSLGWEADGYALDTLPVPESTPWKTWFRTSAIDFFADGRMVVTTYGGDVWVVSGVDRDLLSMRWRRYAGGLYEPMGVKVVDGKVIVLGKDRLTRLHDLNGDGEADFYESFSADPDVSVNFHAFNFDLQVDSKGFLYYAKSGHGADFELPGAIYKISPDGKYREVISTGFRSPNGMGMMPGDRVTVSDNQGQWMPATKINLLRRGGFYGWVPTYDGKGKWAPDGGKIDLKSVVPPNDFDRPMVWMPQVVDNSAGGQLWVDDPRFGPLSDRLLHTSFGRGWMFAVMPQEIDGVTQGAIIKLPFDFRTGIMRAAVNPHDGQVYAVGLDGWNGGGRAGLVDHGIQRLRFTGRAYPMVTDCQVEPDGLRLSFNFELDREEASRIESYRARHWNYLWQASYGSEMYSPATGKVGIDALQITRVEVAEDGQGVKLVIPELRPVDQLHLVLGVNDREGKRFEEEIYWTIHRVPK